MDLIGSYKLVIFQQQKVNILSYKNYFNFCRNEFKKIFNLMEFSNKPEETLSPLSDLLLFTLPILPILCTHLHTCLKAILLLTSLLTRLSPCLPEVDQIHFDVVLVIDHPGRTFPPCTPLWHIPSHYHLGHSPPHNPLRCTSTHCLLVPLLSSAYAEVFLVVLLVFAKIHRSSHSCCCHWSNQTSGYQYAKCKCLHYEDFPPSTHGCP